MSKNEAEYKEIIKPKFATFIILVNRGLLFNGYMIKNISNYIIYGAIKYIKI